MDIQSHCALVTLHVPGLPLKLNRCSCSICRRYGALWAYYSPEDIDVSGASDTYAWGDRMIAFHRCQTCGVLTQWMPIVAGIDKIGVNMQSCDSAQLSQIPEYDSQSVPD
jgi:hypothetical protein